MAKQPPERLMPLIPVVVPAPKVRYPPTARLVVVAAVPVAFVNVRVPMVLRVDPKSVAVAAVERSDWMVDEPSAMRFVNDAKRPESCVVTFKLVVVALVPIPLLKLSVVTLPRVEKKSEVVACVTIALAPVRIPGTLRFVVVAPVKTPLVA